MSQPLNIVIVGAAGDLTARKLVPALCHLHRKGRLPPQTRIAGISRRPLSHDEFRGQLRDMAQRVSPDFDRAAWDKFAPLLEYVSADTASPAGMKPLPAWLAEKEKGQPADRLYYLSVRPEIYGAIVRQLGAAGLTREQPGGPFRRLVVEKPFGRNLAEAVELNRILHEQFAESQIYRIDHYLGKETVQNILVFRFANSLIEPLWNAKYIDHVQITVAEEVDVGHRGETYDQSGVIRDMFQSHLLQVLALTALEAPPSWKPDDLRNEKRRVLDAIPIYSASEAPSRVCTGQYRGYRGAAGVPANSRTPTFAAARLAVDAERWRGVPFYLRSGKALAMRDSEVIIQFRCPNRMMFPLPAGECVAPNRLTLQLQPDEGIDLNFQVKEPDTPNGMKLRTGTMAFDYASTFGRGAIPEAYERLLLDAIHGDASLFMRSDEIERAWAIVDPLIAATERADAPAPTEYERGAWGPARADALLAAEGRHWHNGK
jgi:glucose-6-phosphate 1-dehydrogenase